ncbi:peptide/nickel transport system ATP-binding protein [Rhodospirillales bacterium URHD0017]|nr:peptide/nickel transport system ATP-binding protein [Rhodospirillales bacterium URHD0017]
MSAPLLEVDRVTRVYSSGGLLTRRRVVAVDGVDLRLDEGRPEIVTVIGESGSGKTTLARMILNMVSPSAGAIRFRGTDLSAVRGTAARLAFMRQVQPIFQNPFEAFNPMKRVDRYLFATARHMAGLAAPADIEAAADRALRDVGLSLAEVRRRYPHELSGGQLQRVAIARALVSRPALLVADEPVSMIDASLRASIVNLLRGLCVRTGVSIIYITHDLATAYSVSDRILIMRLGKVVESGPARTVLDDPQHEYSRLLKSSVLSPEVPSNGAFFHA